MARLSWYGLILSLAYIAASGCTEPPDIMNAAPPGTELPPTLPASETKNPAEALGEMAVRGAGVTKPPEASTIPPAPPTAKGEVKKTASGVQYETLKEGKGAETKPGQKAKVLYKGTLENGKVFDSNDRTKPFPLTLGAAGVIQGWQEGLPGMRVGEVRKLTIPAGAAYGAKGQPPDIPPNSTLIFEVEMLGVE